MKIVVYLGDILACYTYRLHHPHAALTGKVQVQYYPFIPNMPGQVNVQVICDHLHQTGADMVMIQRCYTQEIVSQIKTACEFLGIPLVFETDDDYIFLPRHNPAYLAMIPKEKLVGADEARIRQLRHEAVQTYINIISVMDAVIVSTEELKQTLAPYNKNIYVIPNCMGRVWERRDHNPEEAFIEKDPNSPDFNKLVIKSTHRLWSVPDYRVENNKAIQTPRIGYTGTLTHRGEDFDSIRYDWEKLIKKYKRDIWWVFLGDPYFFDHYLSVIKTNNLPHRGIHIPSSEYDLYMFNLRNLDIGIAPLGTNIFNMSKSEIKGMELACWGIPSVLPNYVTYNRFFKHGENALLYNNGREFSEYIELLVNDPQLRNQLGQNALHKVKNERLEEHWAPYRYQVYEEIVSKGYPLKIFDPIKKETANAA